jgi:hypothetical protein
MLGGQAGRVLLRCVRTSARRDAAQSYCTT